MEIAGVPQPAPHSTRNIAAPGSRFWKPVAALFFFAPYLRVTLALDARQAARISYPLFCEPREARSPENPMCHPSRFRNQAIRFTLLLFSCSTLFSVGVSAQAQVAPAQPQQPAATLLQAPLEPAQLPPNTVFYLIWRGSPPASARAANHLLALWDDPEFAPVRSALAESLLNNSQKAQSADKAKPQLTREEIAQIATLLENPFVLGYFGEPSHAAARASKAV